MADRRYKLFKQGLPGSRSFEQRDLADNDVPQWNATTGLWENTSMAGLAALLDHGTLSGLADDDHPQYYLADGSRQLSGQMFFEGSTEDKISLFDNRLGAANMYGFGVEGSTLYSRSQTYHRWYISTNADGGISDYMELSPSALTVNTNASISGELDLSRSGGGIIDSTANGQDLRLRANTAGGIMTDLISANADGVVRLNYAGDIALATEPNGINIYLTDSGGSEARAYFRDSVGTARGLVYAGATFFRLYSYTHGGTVDLYGENLAGTAQPIFTGDPDAASIMYQAGSERGRTTDYGMRLSGPGPDLGSGRGRQLELRDTDSLKADAKVGIVPTDSAGAELGWITWYNQDLYIRVGRGPAEISESTGSFIRLDADSGTGSAPLALFTQGGSGAIYYAGSVRFETASDGAIVNGGTGDARLQIIADSDNLGEGDNAWVELSQDGGAVIGLIGLTQAGTLPNGAAMAGIPDNSLVIANTNASYAVSIVSQNAHVADFYSTEMDLDGKNAFQYSDTWLRLNQDLQFTTGVYTPGLFRADGGVRTDDSGFDLDTNGSYKMRNASVLGQYGTVAVSGQNTGYAGYSISGRVVFMHNDAAVAGIYNDANNEWMLRFDLNSNVQLYNNGVLTAENTGQGMRGRQQTTARINTATGSLGCLEAYAPNTSSDPFITFHRPGSHAFYFGMNSVQELAMGGWSKGANAYPIFRHASSSYSYARVTYSTSAASGGSDGDLWLEY